MNDPHKPEHELYDTQLSNIYRQGRVEEPPMALDSAILTQARKAVKKPVWKRIGWTMPLASVAVALLTVSLLIQMKQQHPEVLSPGLMHDAAPQEERIMQKKNRAEPLMERKRQAVPGKKSAKTAPARRQTPASSAPSSITDTIQVPRVKQGLKKKDRSAVIAPALFKAAPAPVQADSVESELADKELEKLDAAGSPSKQPRSKAESKMSAEAQIDIWLEQIRELIRQGKTEKARESLEAFEKAHPDHPLPEDIASALKKVMRN